MAITTVYSAALAGTLADVKERYVPGAAREVLDRGETLLLLAVMNNNPTSRAEIANFLLDDGADPKWCNQRDGLTYLHVLFGRFSNEPFPEGDVALTARLLDGGADVNAVYNQSGTPLQELIRNAVSYSETCAGPVYDLLFSRDDLDLFKPDVHGNSTYRFAWRFRESLPQLWERVQQYITDRNLTVPDGEAS